MPAFNKAPKLFDGLDRVQNYLENNGFEKGYSLYTVILKTIFPNYLFLQFISAFLDYIVLHYFFKEYVPKYYGLAWAIYLIFQGYVFEIIIIRNTKSIMLFLLSIKYIGNKKPLKYFALNILGFLFHSSAILYFPIYFLCQIKRKPKVELIIFLIGNIFYLLQIKWITEILLNLPILPGRLQSMLNIYLSSEKFSSAYGLTIGYLGRTASFIILYHYSFEFIKEDKNKLIFWYLFLVYIYVYLYFSEMMIILERVPNLFVCSYWVLYPYFYGKINKEKKYIFILCLLFYGSLKMISLFNVKSSYFETFLFSYNDIATRKQYFTY